MPRRLKRFRILAMVIGLVAAILVGLYFYKSFQNHARLPGVPKTWDDEQLADLTIPLASPDHSPTLITSSSYYWIPVRRIYKTYPVYHPDHEPEGYLDQLKTRKPVEIWDTSTLKSEEDWVQAGKLVFEAPLFGGAVGSTSDSFLSSLYVREQRWHEYVRAPLASDGTLPFYRYVVQKKGEVRVGVLSCAMCHTRVLDDGSVVYGAQGNLPFDRAFAYDYQFGDGKLAEHVKLERLLYHAPWISDERRSQATNTDTIVAQHKVIPAGVMARHGCSPDHPVVIPDLFDVGDRRYLDRTGVQQNRGIGDLMRYAALNQGADDLSTYGDFTPIKELIGFVPPAVLNIRGRYSDDQLYALALYLSSLTPPRNPHSLDELAQRGQHIFESQECGRCHTPPEFTSNKLTPVDGFEIPDQHNEKYAIEPESLGTDPGLALATRRGTGYYKIPSLKHAWLRGPFVHDGSCATLEDWFDPSRLDANYVPTGFIGLGIKNRPVPGHEYGLDLDDDDRRALVAYLRTL